MPSTFTTNLRLELQATGENRTTWGNKANNDFSLIEDAITGYVSIAMGDANVTLTTLNAVTDQARKAAVELTGTNTAIRTVFIPTVSKLYVIRNATSGGFAITVSNGTNTVSISNGRWSFIWTNGTAVYSLGTDFPYRSELADLSGVTNASTARTNLGLGTMATQAATGVNITGGSITGITDLAIADGGTGASNAAAALANLGGQATNATLTAFAAYNTNGLITQTAANTFTGRTITGTANEITATNGNGVSGNPTISIPAAVTFTGKTITGGTYTSGTFTSGAFNGTLGATTPSTVSATTGAFSGAVSMAGLTATTGSFSSALTSSSTVTALQNFQSSSVNVVLGTTGAGTVFLRPNGIGSATGQTTINSSGDLTAAGDLTGSSDGRLKKDIQSLDRMKACMAVDSIGAISFKRIATDDKSIGFIAQDIRPHYPELVKVDDNGMLSLAYPNMVAVLWEVVKDLRQRLAKVESK